MSDDEGSKPEADQRHKPHNSTKNKPVKKKKTSMGKDLSDGKTGSINIFL